MFLYLKIGAKKIKMKTRILVYGDSNTWGSGAFGGRYDSREQWPNILQEMLGSNYEIVQEGLCGRISGDHDKKDLHRNGRLGFEIALRSACPVEYVIIALGTNDLKRKYHLSAKEIVDDLFWFNKRTEQYARDDSDMRGFKSIIYVGVSNYRPSEYFDADPELCLDVNRLLAESGLPFVEPNDLEHSKDGLHYSKADHRKVAKLVYDKFKEIEV